MDNIYSVFVAALPAFAVLAAFNVAAKSVERVLLARWDVAKAEAKLGRAGLDYAELHAKWSKLTEEHNRTKSELEKLRSMPVPRARF